MANGEQMEQAVNEAKAAVARYGYTNKEQLSDRAVMLAGFGYLADKLEKQTVRIKLSGKKTMVGVIVAVVGLVVGVFQAI